MKGLRLGHGGIMANYACTAACRHCLYACSPDRSGGYITPEMAARVCKYLRKGGCRSVHIGGGEPFLSFKGLLDLLEAARTAGIAVEYIETNGYWALGNQDDKVLQKLRHLLECGADTLCISVDPFHAEYVPVEGPVNLARLCRQAGMGFFLWKQQYLHDLAALEMGRPYSRQELEQALSSDYIYETSCSYGIGYGGRAINIEREYRPSKPWKELVDRAPCMGLVSTGHFHVDLHGNFIPPGCTGIVLPLEEVVEGIPDDKYEVLEGLLHGGVAGLLDYARAHGYRPEGAYPSKCALCFHIRHWLAMNVTAKELDREHYEASLSYYS